MSQYKEMLIEQVEAYLNTATSLGGRIGLEAALYSACADYQCEQLINRSKGDLIEAIVNGDIKPAPDSMEKFKAWVDDWLDEQLLKDQHEECSNLLDGLFNLGDYSAVAPSVEEQYGHAYREAFDDPTGQDLDIFLGEEP